jgi:Na+-transporting NADH:ubiquinone oxidoreductase subunit NqrB
MTLKKPNLDPRWFQAAILLAYALVAREIFHFERPHWVTLSCLTWGVALDLALGAALYRRVNPPLSAAIIALACSLLLDSFSPWVYLTAVSLAIFSKAWLTVEGRHYFNPANFGVVLVLVLGADWATGSPALWGGAWIPSAAFAVLGLWTAWAAGQADISLGWLAGFGFLAFLRSLVFHQDWRALLAIVSAPSFLLFTFHMITDPATSPRTSGRRQVYALSIATLDAGFRALKLPYGNFYGLFVVSAFMPWLGGTPRDEAGSGEGSGSGRRRGPGRRSRRLGVQRKQALQESSG